jgi:hypothetical protein
VGNGGTDCGGIANSIGGTEEELTWGDCCSKLTFIDVTGGGVEAREGGAEDERGLFITEFADTVPGAKRCGGDNGIMLGGDMATGIMTSSDGSILGALITRSPCPFAMDEAQRFRLPSELSRLGWISMG